MNVAGINFESIADGIGVRVVVFVSGCLHNCVGCHNPTSHSFTAGRPFTQELQDEIVTYLRSTPFITGLTLSGGDPMYSAAELIPFVQRVRNELPEISIWIYSGFTYEEVIQDKDMFALLKLCDVLVDGLFVLEQRDITLAYRGSTNQRLIDIPASIAANEATEIRGIIYDNNQPR